MEVVNYRKAMRSDEMWAWMVINALINTDHAPFEDPESIEIDLKINGVEASFVDVIKRLEEHRKREVGVGASNLATEAVLAKTDIIAQFMDGLEEKIEDARETMYREVDKVVDQVVGKLEK